MGPKSFSVKQAISFGWDLWKKNWLLLSGIYLFSLILPGSAQLLIYLLPQNADIARFILSIIHYILLVIANMGMITIALKVAKGNETKFTDFFSTLNLFPSYLWGWILYGIAVVVGLILLIIPGIIFAVMFSLWAYFIIDRSATGYQSLVLSKDAVYGVKWDLLLLFVISFFLNLFGLLLLGIGLLVTAPITILAWTYAYLTLTQEVTPQNYA